MNTVKADGISDLDLIKTIPGDHAQAILLFLCANNSILKKAASHARGLASRTTGPLKRKAESVIAICVQCDQPFDTNENTEKDCIYHNGELEVDYDGDAWADHDERCHGTIDTDEMREEHPDGFVWSCCDKSGEEKGCKFGRHQADPAKSKKESYESESTDTEADEEGSFDDEDDDEDNE
ncbi:hypothetical protein PT974_07243 [Cladobotryum mycophilum]|uniref:C2H2-type domain-containing protein n=1 Tax=Cladobotryum mycophilum TaxID=491253 RepID=A0ABR0SNP7_9HYPO